MKRERQIFFQEGCPAVRIILMGLSLAFESWPWEAATGNAERNKSVRLFSFLFYSGVVFVFFPFLLVEAKFSCD